jgi:ABC-type lipoprotein export system ATPase subunit
MEILFSKIVPIPIAEKDINQSQIWNRDIYLKSGDKLLIYADSGKGKTTLVNILFGNRKDYTGDLYIDSKKIKEYSLHEISQLRKTRISIVAQSLLLFSDLTVIENIQLKNKIQNFFSAQQLKVMLQSLGLDGFENRKSGTLSYGQQQRVAIIRALCQSFEFILLDEAFSHLDTTNTKIALNMILEEVNKRNAGIIITSLEDLDVENFTKLRI